MAADEADQLVLRARVGGHLDLQQLRHLPGLSPRLAQAIIDARPLGSVEQLRQIEGIGPRTLEKLRDFITV